MIGAPAEPNPDLAAAAREAVRDLGRTVKWRTAVSKEDVQCLRTAVAALESPAEQPDAPPPNTDRWRVATNPFIPEISYEMDAAGFHGHVTFSSVFEGIGEFAHGGFIGVALEVAIGTAAQFHAISRSATMTVDYKSPAPLGRRLDLHGQVDSIEGRKHWVSGAITDGDTTIAEARGLWIALPPASGSAG